MRDWVAYRFSLQCADRKGRVYGTGRLNNRTVRIALFLDLVLRGRYSAFGLGIDTTRIGFAPADALLQHIDQRPSDSVRMLFNSAPVGVLDVLSAAGHDTKRHGFGRVTRVDPAVVAYDRKLLDVASETGRVDSSATAVLLVLADTIGWVAAKDIDILIARCGPASPFMADIRQDLEQFLTQLTAVTVLPSASSGS